ncbi:MAG: Ankyrin repeat and SOCS box protein 3 [Alectoria fallacina]|uniref:Ankyrin repeat and SOCS box protein 3 n=1 Tax=Alectoria fallacina TaxID=1903189 RepID=A0A8H3PLG2_9LECA|nr:MAG: Ankyrin repeat and SOCS box protein 3 [Alectoria fallacina]
MTACATGEQLLATKLIDHGANIRAISHTGKTPLHRAAFEGKAHMIPLLIANGAALEAKTLGKYQGFTPLHMAAGSPSDASDTVELLLQAGADKDATSEYLSTPLHIASKNHNKACLSCLLRYGANPNAADRRGWTSLDSAMGHMEICKALLDHGANPTISIKNVGNTPSGVHMENDLSSTRKKSIFTLLKEHEKTWKQSSKK